MLLIYLINDLQMSRKQLFHQVYRPALQGLWKHRVVGVCEGLLGDLPCLREKEGLSSFPLQERWPITQNQTFPKLPPVCNGTVHLPVRHAQFYQVPEWSRDWEYVRGGRGRGGKQLFAKLSDKTEDNILIRFLYYPNMPFIYKISKIWGTQTSNVFN